MSSLLEGLVLGALMFCASTACVVALYVQARDAQKDALQSELGVLARQAASLVDADIHARIRSSEKIESPEYARAIAPLVRFHRNAPQLAYLFTAVLDGDTIRYILDTSTQAGQLAGVEALSPSAPMDAYEIPDPLLRLALRTGLPQVNTEPFENGLGVFIRGFAPIFARDGRIEGAAGVDLDASKYTTRLGSVRRAAGLAVAIALMLAIGTTVMVYGRRSVSAKQEKLWHVAEEQRRRTQQSHAELTETVRQNRLLLDAASQTYRSLLSEQDVPSLLPQILRTLGTASRGDRVYYFERVQSKPPGTILFSQRFEWCASAITSQIANPDMQDFDMAANGMGDWLHTLLAGQCINARTVDLPDAHRQMLEAQQVLSLLVVPVMLEDACEGFLGFDDCTIGHPWYQEEVSVLQSVAAKIGLHILRARSESAREADRALLSGVLESSLHGFVAMQTAGGGDGTADDLTLSLINPPAAQMLGIDATTALGRSIRSPGLSPLLQALEVDLRNVAATGTAFQAEREIEGREPGASRWVHVGATRMRDGIAISFHDISERKAAERQIVMAQEAAESADRSKSEFLAVMSHEMRTPLNGVIGFASLLDGTGLDETQREHVDHIQRSGASLLALITDILDFSKIESGMLELESRPLSIADIIGNTLSITRHGVAEKPVEITVDIAPDVPDAVIGDADRLQQVLVNLVGNACKFTERGRIAINVRVSTLSSTEVELAFEIADTGVGMTRAQLEQLFKPFSQADSSTTRRFGGSGLGLAICDRLCRLMRGSVTARSEPGVGSVFEFRVPFPIDSGHASAPAGRGGRNSAATSALPDASVTIPLSILVVEDNPINRRVCTLLLKRLGHTCAHAADGQEGVKAWQQTRHDLVLMDVQMPVMDGLAATRLIREIEAQSPDQRRSYICAVTAGATNGDRDRCLESGMDAYMTKPIEAQGLAGLLVHVQSLQSQTALR